MAGDYFLADDLSGALDAAAAFHAVGRRVRIRLDPEPVEPAGRDEILGYTTETRNTPEVQAAATVRALLEAQARRGARLLYKKIDSTLRGPVGAEVAALMEALPRTRVLFTSANPVVGRTVRGGILHVNGVPVAETEFSRDPANPVRFSEVSRVLGLPAGERLQLSDAQTENDLERLVDEQVTRGGDWVAVGSGGLARPVARRMGFGPAARPAPLRLPGCEQLIVCGSSHPLNLIQENELRRVSGIHSLVVDPRLASGFDPVLLPRVTVQVIRLPVERMDPVQALGSLVEAAAAIVRERGIRRLLVTGGETAFALARALGESEFAFRGELEPGLSLSSTSAGGPRLWAVKPGGFGDARTWCRASQGLAGAGLAPDHPGP